MYAVKYLFFYVLAVSFFGGYDIMSLAALALAQSGIRRMSGKETTGGYNNQKSDNRACQTMIKQCGIMV